ncbi:MAG TPA: NAD(P)-dependent oxidoreductase [Thermoplasmata archaeon]|nr:NAD(P)-dependent oxidoreductase [Thermoplasmata archaeon]
MTGSAATNASPSTVGLVGIGAIGGGIGLSLRRAGLPLTITSRRAEPARELVAAGAEWKKDARQVGRAVGSGIAFVAVPDARTLNRVLFGRSGLAKGLVSGALVVQTGTIAPDQTRTVAARLGELGISMLDAPVGGSREPARLGQLLLYVGGSAADLERARPVLSAVSREIVHVGDVGLGSAMKLANNLVTLGTVELLSESLALAVAAGIDRDRALEIFGKGGARSTMLESKRPMLSVRQYETNFRLDLARKDLKLIERAASQFGRPLPVAHQIRRMFDRAVSEGRGAQDFAAVFETVLGSPAVPPATTAASTEHAPAPPGPTDPGQPSS